jgi:hypothetical protein
VVRHDAVALGGIALALIQGGKNDPESYTFLHHSFAEYLAIRYLANESETPEEFASKYADLGLTGEKSDIAEHVADERWASGGYRLREALSALGGGPVPGPFRNAEALKAHMSGWPVPSEASDPVLRLLETTRHLAVRGMEEPSFRPVVVVTSWSAVESAFGRIPTSSVLAEAEVQGLLTAEQVAAARTLCDARNRIVHSESAGLEIAETVDLARIGHEVVAALHGTR